jgi:hypothetical protein
MDTARSILNEFENSVEMVPVFWQLIVKGSPPSGRGDQKGNVGGLYPQEFGCGDADERTAGAKYD